MELQAGSFDREAFDENFQGSGESLTAFRRILDRIWENECDSDHPRPSLKIVLCLRTTPYDRYNTSEYEDTVLRVG